jgi:hypothetical protein
MERKMERGRKKNEFNRKPRLEELYGIKRTDQRQ